MSGSTSAGEILGTLRLSITDFETNIAKAQEMADRLDGKNVDVQVRVDSAGAEAKLAGVAASEDRVDAGNKKVASSSQEAGKGLGLMSMAIVGLGPAIVPLAAGAAGLAVGFGAMGAAGILAIVGIKAQMAAGTPVGAAYTGMVGTLKGDLTELGTTAAKGVLAPFQKEVATLQGQMPALNGIIGEFSVITGKTAGNLMSGLVAAFIALEPLARDVGVYVLDLSGKFTTLMSGSGVTAFGDYIRSVFPQVMQTVESVVTAAVHLIAALAPLGMGVLSELKMFSDVINALPVDVLSTLATVGASVFIGFKAFSLLSGGITAVGTALTAVGVSAETAAGGMLALNVAAGAIGILITIASLAFTAHAAAAQADQSAVDSLTDALIRSNGVMDENARKTVADSLQAAGAGAAYRELGGTLSDLTLAASGDAPALERVNATMATAKTNAALASYAVDGGNVIWKKYGDNVAVVNGALSAAGVTLATSTQKQKDYAALVATSASTTGTLTTATLLGMNAQQQSESTNKTQIATIKALNATMDEEISKELQLAGATSNVDQATLTMNTTLKANNRTMDEHTQKGIDDRRAIEGVVGSLQSQRDANIKSGMSTADATVKYQSASAALLDQTGKMYGTTSQAYKYMKQLLAIPANVKTQVDVATAEAKAKAAELLVQLDHLPRNKGVTVDVKANFSMGTGGANSMGFFTNAPGGADGGPVTGGVPGKDSVLRTLMPKEYIVRADGSNLADAAAYYGVAAPGMAAGGPVGMLPPPVNTRMNQASLAFLSGVHVNPAALGAGGSAGGAAQWAPLVSMALMMLGQPASSLAGNLRRINLESGGNPNAINLTDSNAMAGHPSIGLMQVIAGTFAAYAGAFAGRGQRDPFASIYAGDNYAIHEYGSVAAVDPLIHPGGYDTGGMMMPNTAGANYGSKPERVMSGSQTEWFEAGVAAAGGGGGGGFDYDRLAAAMSRVQIAVSTQIDGREIGRAAVNHMDNAISGGLTMTGVS